MHHHPREHDSAPSKSAFYRLLPRSIWMLGFASLFTDISSELVHSLLPLFMTTVLGASMVTVGVIEGVAEATAAVTKVFSGTLSDYVRKRKFLVVLGYGLGALTKLIFPLAHSIEWVFGARFVDRIGKGVRDAPRDALIADIVPTHLRGAAYGLRQSLDSVGAFVGPLLAMALMLWLANDLQAVLWVAVIPALLAVSLIIFGVHEPASATPKNALKPALSWRDLGRLSPRFWAVVILGAVFTLARFSEAFLLLRAQDVGLAVQYVPVVMIVMNVVYALFAYPAGLIADRFSMRWLLMFGLSALVLADVLLALASGIGLVLGGAVFWGLHMAFTQGLLAKMVVDSAPSHLRGTAFGVFHLVSGGALLLASVIAGLLWSHWGAQATFFAGALFALIAAVGLWFYSVHHEPEVSYVPD